MAATAAFGGGALGGLRALLPGLSAQATAGQRLGALTVLLLAVLALVAAVLTVAGVPVELPRPAVWGLACAVAVASALADGSAATDDGGSCACGPGLAEQLLQLHSGGAGDAPHVALQGNLAEADARVLAGAVRECGPRAGLEGLSVTHCPLLGPEALGELVSAALSPGTRLRLLDLSGNVRLGDVGAVVLAAALRGKGGQALCELSLADCSLTAAGAGALAWGAMVAQEVHEDPLEEGEVPKRRPPAGVPRPPPVAAVAPARTDVEEAEATAAPPPPPPPSALGREAAASRLQRLSLSGNALAGAGPALARLARWPRLEELRLERCGLAAEDLTRLAAALRHTRLTRLDLGSNNLAGHRLLAVAGALPRSRLQDLGLEHCGLSAGDALDALRGACAERRVARVRLQGNRLSSRELEALAGATRGGKSAFKRA